MVLVTSNTEVSVRRFGRVLVLASVFIATVAEASLPVRPETTDLFSEGLHSRYSRRAFARAAIPDLYPSTAAVALLDQVQHRIDRPITGTDVEQGDKSEGTWYLHYVWPNHGYTAVEHAKVLDELGVEHRAYDRATLGQFVEVSRRRFEDQLVALLVARPNGLDSREVGMVLYAVGIRLHTVQDRKHRFQASGAELDIHSYEHFLRFPGQLWSDLAPRRWRRDIAIEDTQAFFLALHEMLGGSPARDRRGGLYGAIGAFSPSGPVDARALLPDIASDSVRFTMEYIFPSYAEQPE